MTDEYSEFERQIELTSRAAIAQCRKKFPVDSGAVIQALVDAVALVIVTTAHPQTPDSMMRLAKLWGDEITHAVEQQLKQTGDQT